MNVYSSTFHARYPGLCHGCGQPIRTGQKVRYVNPDAVRPVLTHAPCVPEDRPFRRPTPQRPWRTPTGA